MNLASRNGAWSDSYPGAGGGCSVFPHSVPDVCIDSSYRYSNFYNCSQNRRPVILRGWKRKSRQLLWEAVLLLGNGQLDNRNIAELPS